MVGVGGGPPGGRRLPRRRKPSMDNACWLHAGECGASGSEVETRAAAAAGNPVIEADDSGDFSPGQWVSVSRCHVHYSDTRIFEAGASIYGQPRPAGFAGRVECRGFDDARVPWQVFVLHVNRDPPGTFDWLVIDPAFQPNHRRWTWQGRGVPLESGWQSLMDGVEVRFLDARWEPGQLLAFHARSRLVARIRAVERRRLTLDACPNRTVDDAVVRHLDQAPLQAAVERAAAERRPLFLPAGRYRLLTGLALNNLALRVEGAGADRTILDISDGCGAVFQMQGGREVTVRNLGMVGHTGLNELPWYSIRLATGRGYWPNALKPCAAAHIAATERVLFEDVAARRMATEAFYSGGPDRFGADESGDEPSAPRPYTKSITYHRCRVSDCAANAFNNNDLAENTRILNCHVENVHNFWEGASRFTRILGNYCRNAHCGSIGNISRLRPLLLRLGSGQAVIANNVFEGGTFGAGLSIGYAPTQVVVADNLFVNFSNATAISITGLASGARAYPARGVIVRGNLIDLTHVAGQLDRERAGIAVGASNVIVADNQIVVRGPAPANVAGIQVSELAVNVRVHDNLIDNCAWGLRTGFPVPEFAVATGAYEGLRQSLATEGTVAEVLGAATWRVSGLPTPWEFASYGGWVLHGLSGGLSDRVATVADYDLHARVLTLAAPLPARAGERFAIAPAAANWDLHHNTLAGCRQPVRLEGYGSVSSRFADNLVVCPPGVVAGEAIRVSGAFQAEANRVVAEGDVS